MPRPTSLTPLIAECPLECRAGFDLTAIVLPEGPLLRCRACGQLVSQVDADRYAESMTEFDDPRGTLPDAGSSTRRDELARRRLERVRRLVGKPAGEIHLLDVGCSSGAFLQAARGYGYLAQGVEPAPRAAATARASGLEVFVGTLEQARFPERRFDAITLFEVIEHLASPLPLVRECHRILKPGGVLLIGTGNTASWTVQRLRGRWQYFHIERHGGHVSFFSTVSMRILARRTGFRVAALDTRNVRLMERGDGGSGAYGAARLAGELLALPARALGRGHDMLAFLQKPAAGT